VIQERDGGQHPHFGRAAFMARSSRADPKEEIVAAMMIQTFIREMRPECENAMRQAIIK
jgi:hypothetical protein